MNLPNLIEPPNLFRSSPCKHILQQQWPLISFGKIWSLQWLPLLRLQFYNTPSLFYNTKSLYIYRSTKSCFHFIVVLSFRTILSLSNSPVITMTNPQVLSGELKAGRRRKTVVTHVLRSWEARNVKKGGDLMGVYLVLLDEKVWRYLTLPFILFFSKSRNRYKFYPSCYRDSTYTCNSSVLNTV